VPGGWTCSAADNDDDVAVPVAIEAVEADVPHGNNNSGSSNGITKKMEVEAEEEKKGNRRKLKEEEEGGGILRIISAFLPGRIKKLLLIC
jgi:hypothetical protein